MTRLLLVMACASCLIGVYAIANADQPSSRIKLTVGKSAGSNEQDSQPTSDSKAPAVVYVEDSHSTDATALVAEKGTAPGRLTPTREEDQQPSVKLANGVLPYQPEIAPTPAPVFMPPTPMLAPASSSLTVRSSPAESIDVGDDIGCVNCDGNGCGNGCGSGCSGGLRDQIRYLHRLHHPHRAERPFGSFTHHVLHMQAVRGMADQMMLYDYDFGYGQQSAELTMRGKYQLQKFASMASRFGITIGIETKLGDSALDARRRANVLAALKAIEPTATDDWIAVGFPNPAGLRGEEAVLIDNTNLRQTESRGTLAPAGSQIGGDDTSSSSSF